MNEVFADTTGWANYFVRTEPFHQNAKELMQQWYKDQTSVITTKFNQETSNFNNWGQSKINSNLVLEPTQKTALLKNGVSTAEQQFLFPPAKSLWSN